MNIGMKSGSVKKTACMFKNYFKTAFRNLARNKIYSFINIAGLSTGLTCAMLIMLYVKDEISFDRFHKNADNIYRIGSKMKMADGEQETGITGWLPGPRFEQNVPGIKAFSRMQQYAQDTKIGTEVQVQDLFRVDTNFFSVFTFPLISGNPKTCLIDPHSIVLSEDASKKHFGTADAVGKTVMLKDDSVFVPYKVTAVAKNCPQNSSIRFSALTPIRLSDEDAKNNMNWFNSFLNTFVVLEDNANRQMVEMQMQSFYEKDARLAFDDLRKKYGGIVEEMGSYFLQPFTDMHLSTNLPPGNGLSGGSSPMYSYILSGIALFVLFIACINFVNLAVARSVKRAREIGIRKVVGGDRKQLIMQFLGESFFLCAIAFALAILLVTLLLPLFSGLTNKTLSVSYLVDTKLVAGYLLLLILTGLLAGFYPSLLLSGYSPVETLYSRFNISGKNYLQKSLVVLQFTLASFLIIATLTIYNQFDFLTNADLGYDDSNFVEVHKYDVSHTKASVFKTALLKNRNIAGVSAKNSGSNTTGAKLSNDSVIQFRYETIDESFLSEFKIPIVRGRNFSSDFPSDASNSVLVNEAFVKQAGWKEPIGETVNFWYRDSDAIYHVVGVVKNYHYAPLNEEIGPQLFTMRDKNNYGVFYIKIKPEKTSESLAFIQHTFTEFFPLSPYAYTFKDEENRRQYDDIARWKQILLFGAALTIIISCVGLFSLSVLSAEKRTKEIGIRKVLGASVNNVVTILSRDFIKLVLIALLIASPPAYLAADIWLQNFPYRVTLSWWFFAITACLVIVIALATVSFQAIKAAIANPVKSLRAE